MFLLKESYYVSLSQQPLILEGQVPPEVWEVIKVIPETKREEAITTFYFTVPLIQECPTETKWAHIFVFFKIPESLSTVSPVILVYVNKSSKICVIPAQ